MQVQAKDLNEYKALIYKDLFKKISINLDTDQERLKQELYALVPTRTKTAQDLMKHVFSSPGKLIRPSLYFMISNLIKLESPYYYKIAAVGELVHIASLLHDDVVDNSFLRRNKPTARTLWGDQASILVGDLIYSRASEIMAASGELELVEIFAKAIR